MNVTNDVAEAIKVIQGESREKYEAMLKIVAKHRKDINDLERVQETLSDIAFDCGFRFSKLDQEVAVQVEEHVGGSSALRGLFIEWACEFDKKWVEVCKGHSRTHDYIEEVDNFVEEKWATLVAIVRLEPA